MVVIRHFLTGDWDDAGAEFAGVVDLCEEVEDRSGAIDDTSGVLAVIAVHRGDFEAAHRLVPATDPRGAPEIGCWLVRTRPLLVEASGAPDRAIDLLWSAWEANRGSGNAATFLALGPPLVRLLVPRGHSRVEMAGEATRHGLRRALVDDAS